MSPPFPSAAGSGASAAREPRDTAQRDETLRRLDRLALRTAARARAGVRARIAERAGDAGAASGTAVCADVPCSAESFRQEDADALPSPSRVAVQPGLPRWIGSVLCLLRGSSTVLRPERGPDGSVRDYTVVAANQHEMAGRGRDPAELLGRPLSEVRPGAVASGMYDLYAAALERSGPVSTEHIDYVAHSSGSDGRISRIRLRGTVTPLAGEGLLLTNWEPRGEASIGRRAQEAVRMGWAEWDLVNDKVQWSASLRELLGLTAPLPGERDPEAGPDAMTSGDLAPTVVSAQDVDADLWTVGRLVDPADVRDFASGIRRLLSGQEVADRVTTLHIDGEERVVRWLGFPRPAGAETPESVLFAVRDITEQERELRSARSDAERMRQEAAAERRVSETLRKALTPPLPAVTPSWLSVGAAYVPCDSRVGGDWYKCRELPDGRVLVAVGDASGHGVDAASRAVQQRSALAGLAYTGGDPAQLAMALGEVVYYGGIDTTATAVIGHLDPETRVFRWASAGHPSPILVRDNVPRVLDAEHGLMLGVAAEPSYPVNTTQLAPGDLLLLYTDGVVERRGHDLDSGVASLLEAVVSCAARGADAQTATDCLMSTLLGPGAEDDATILGLHLA